MTIGSLFSGIGGIELGLEWAGLGPVKWQVEIDRYCRKVLERHWPDAKRYEDIRNVGKHNLEPVDLICGGFPCQPFSIAGKQRGGTDDRALWPEMRRVITELMPAWVVAENVPQLVNVAQYKTTPPVDREGNPAGNIGDVFTRHGRGYADEVLESLETLGYIVTLLEIPAVAVDAQHLRSRIWIVAHTGHRSGRDIGVAETRSNTQRERTTDYRAARGSDSESGFMADADRERKQQSRCHIPQSGERTGDGGETIPHAGSRGCDRKQGEQGEKPSERRWTCEDGDALAHPYAAGREEYGGGAAR